MVNKIIFSGIDNAGKTSIIYTIKNQYQFLSGLKPTKGIRRRKYNLLGIDFILWDLGGQLKHRENYFDKKDFIFTNVDLLIYVIDIQDEERYDEAENYYHRIIDAIKSYNESPEIIILFHKMDPELKFEPKLRMFVEDLKKRFKSNGFEITFFETSIFQRWSLINAFSYGLRKLFEKGSGNIVEYLKEWSKILETKSLILINNEDIIIGEIFKDDSSYKEVNENMNNIVNIAKGSLETGESTIIKTANSLFCIDPIHIGDHDLLLVNYTDEVEKFDEIISYTIDFSTYNNLENVLNDYFRRV
ncbi:MAG: hypothetical protein GF329_19715 [Candidatus Lokiarchaeota archaeon]|nr:hypothetical protein [Candidatus Lokiarchaeota archaeon]